jgi:hypothetical protein
VSPKTIGEQGGFGKNNFSKIGLVQDINTGNDSKMQKHYGVVIYRDL